MCCASIPVRDGAMELARFSRFKGAFLIIIGMAKDRGQGVKQSDKEAARWYQKAADQGRAGS